MKSNTTLKTLTLRVRDNRKTVLNRMATEVNQVWNYCNELSSRSIRERQKWLTPFDLNNYTSGATKEFDNIASVTIQAVGEQYAVSRNSARRRQLKWRTSRGSRKSLGWVPFKKKSVVYVDGQIRFAGKYFKVWDSYGLSGYTLGAGSFSQDRRGRWYINILVEVPYEQSRGKGEIGVDLGLKTTAVCSDGVTLSRSGYYRNCEEKLGLLSRAGKKKQYSNLHAKIKNRRADTNHKFSTQLVRNNSLIVVGDVSSSKLAKTAMAKSVFDAGWSQLKMQLDYKSKRMRVAYIQVNESYTTQTCSCCRQVDVNSPRGRSGLDIREWTCTQCGTKHDRDINSAKNILALGHESLIEGAPSRCDRGDANEADVFNTIKKAAA